MISKDERDPLKSLSKCTFTLTMALKRPSHFQRRKRRRCDIDPTTSPKLESEDFGLVVELLSELTVQPAKSLSEAIDFTFRSLAGNCFQERV